MRLVSFDDLIKRANQPGQIPPSAHAYCLIALTDEGDGIKADISIYQKDVPNAEVMQAVIAVADTALQNPEKLKHKGK